MCGSVIKKIEAIHMRLKLSTLYQNLYAWPVSMKQS